MSVQIVAHLIDVPVDKWPGNCFYIASKMVEKGLAKGSPTYGFYHGFVSDKSVFGGKVFVRHGWVMSETKIVDPTRWVFEAVEPYIYTGPKDDSDYDMGANAFKHQILQPAPEFDEKDAYKMPENLIPMMQNMLNTDRDEIGVSQLIWLASNPLDLLGNEACSLYRWIVDEVGMPGFIPIDNRLFVLGK